MGGKRGMGAQRSDVPCLKSPSKSIAQVGIKGGYFIHACPAWHCNCTRYSAAWARSWVCPERSCTALSLSETMSNPRGCLFILSLSCLRFRAVMVVMMQHEGRWHSHCHMMLRVFSFPSHHALCSLQDPHCCKFSILGRVMQEDFLILGAGK